MIKEMETIEKKKSVLLYLSPDVIENLDKYKKRSGRSKAWFVNKVLKQWFIDNPDWEKREDI